MQRCCVLQYSQSETKRNQAGTKLEPSKNQANIMCFFLISREKEPSGTKLEPSWSQAKMLRFVILAIGNQEEPSWNQAGTKQEPSKHSVFLNIQRRGTKWNQTGTKLEPSRL